MGKKIKKENITFVHLETVSAEISECYSLILMHIPQHSYTLALKEPGMGLQI